MNVFEFWKCALGAFALAWSPVFLAVAWAELFGEGGLFRRRPPETPDPGLLEAVRRVRAARHRREGGGPGLPDPRDL